MPCCQNSLHLRIDTVLPVSTDIAVHALHLTCTCTSILLSYNIITQEITCFGCEIKSDPKCNVSAPPPKLLYNLTHCVEFQPPVEWCYILWWSSITVYYLPHFLLKNILKFKKVMKQNRPILWLWKRPRRSLFSGSQSLWKTKSGHSHTFTHFILKTKWWFFLCYLFILWSQFNYIWQKLAFGF